MSNYLNISRDKYMPMKRIDLLNNSHGITLKTEMAKNQVKELEGIIEVLYPIGTKVYAIVRRNHPPEEDSSGITINHGDGLFNAHEGLDPKTYTLPELLIPTDIDIRINGKLKKYIGIGCKVKLFNDIARFAYINQENSYPTVFRVEHLMEAKAYSLDNTLTDPRSRAVLYGYGYSDAQINALNEMKYLPESMQNCIITVQDEAYGYKMTTDVETGEASIPPNIIQNGLFKLGMKTKKCNLPPKFLSAR